MKYLIILAVLLSGCNTPNSGNMVQELGNGLAVVELDSGLMCVKYSGGYQHGGGLSCNWEKYNEENGL